MATANPDQNEETDRLYDQLYEIYGKPLEAQHAGKYVVISKDGKTILGASMRDVARQAKATFGPGNFLYKVGDKAVGKWL